MALQWSAAAAAAADADTGTRVIPIARRPAKILRPVCAASFSIAPPSMS
jgi:hypothetical protein